MKNNNTVNRLAIICGGTGGHFYPGLTIARAFQKDKNNKACLFIGGHKVGNQVVDAKKYGVDIKEVKSAKISKYPIKFIIFAIKLILGYIEGRKLLREFKPDAVLAMGSFTSVPISLSAPRMKIPLFLHDGNARIGKANIFLSRWAKLIMTAFPPVNHNLLRCNYIYTGMPLRPEIFNNKLSKQEAVEEINKKYNCSFHHNIATILVFGGSQGAATINNIIPKTIPTLKTEKIQIIHLTGENNSQTTMSLYQDITMIPKETNTSGNNMAHRPFDHNEIYNTQQKNLYNPIVGDARRKRVPDKYNYIVLESSNNMSLLYSVADLIICRSGGNTIAELAFFEKPAILIPYPLAPDLHQNDNAKFYAKSGPGEIIYNNECTEIKMKQLISMNH